MVRITLAALLVVLAGAASAQTGDGVELQEQVRGTVDAARSTQQELDDWAGEREALQLRYRTAQANIDYLDKRAARRQEEADALDAKIAELRRRLEESDRLAAVIEDTMHVLLGRLESAVARDLPFLQAERSARLDDLRHLFAAPDVAAAEKLRRLLEAMLVEAQYGGTVEVTPEMLAIDGEELHVDVLRIGRLALFWRAPDGSRVGTWNPREGAWTDLDGGQSRTIGRAMEMASRMRPPELIALPLGRLAGGEVQ